jgi:chorismate-pyruvate lyase
MMTMAEYETRIRFESLTTLEEYETRLREGSMSQAAETCFSTWTVEMLQQKLARAHEENAALRSQLARVRKQ